MITSFELSQEIPYLLFSFQTFFICLAVFFLAISLFFYLLNKKQQAQVKADQSEINKGITKPMGFSIALFILSFISILIMAFFGIMASKYSVTTDHLSKLASAESTIIQLKASSEALGEKTGLDVELADKWIKHMRTEVRDNLSLRDYYKLANEYNDLGIGYNKMVEWFAENTPEKIQQEITDQFTMAKTQQVQAEQMKLQSQPQQKLEAETEASETEMAEKFSKFLEQ